MNSRKYVISIVVFWIIVILFFIIASLLHRHKHVDLYRAAPGGTNIVFPYLAGSHTIDYFTGSNFAAYDTKTQTTKTISPQFILPTVSQMRWSKTGVLFQAGDYSATDNLYPALIKKGLPINAEYWWFYDFATQKLNTVLTPNPINGVMDAFWNSSGDNYCYIGEDGRLYVSDLTHSVGKVGSDARIKQFNGTTITLAQGSMLRQISTDGHYGKTFVDDNLQDAYVSPDGKTIAYVLNTHPDSSSVVPGDLYKVDPATGKSHMVLSGFSGAMAGSGGNLYAGYSDSDGKNYLQLYPENGKPIDYSLGASLNRGDLISTVLPVSPRLIYVVSKSTNLVEITNQEKPVSTPVSYRYKIQTDLYENGFEIHYDPYKNTYEIDISANPFTTYQNAALEYIRAQRVDPNQINIIWRGYEGVNTTNPAVDTTPISSIPPA